MFEDLSRIVKDEASRQKEGRAGLFEADTRRFADRIIGYVINGRSVEGLPVQLSRNPDYRIAALGQSYLLDELWDNKVGRDAVRDVCSALKKTLDMRVGEFYFNPSSRESICAWQVLSSARPDVYLVVKEGDGNRAYRLLEGDINKYIPEGFRSCSNAVSLANFGSQRRRCMRNPPRLRPGKR